jgi:molybdopterin converting factor small subunit
MAILVRIPTPLKKLANGQTTVEAEGGSIWEVVLNLDSRYPGIREKLYDGEAQRRFVNIYLNEEDIRFLEGKDTPVRDGDQLSIIPAIAGGNRRFKNVCSP